jgi:hypothetical protein
VQNQTKTRGIADGKYTTQVKRNKKNPRQGVKDKSYNDEIVSHSISTAHNPRYISIFP